VSLRRDGTLVQVDRVGNPSFNPFFVDELKNKFNAGHPSDDVANSWTRGQSFSRAAGTRPPKLGRRR
jgi:hypothetical protein